MYQEPLMSGQGGYGVDIFKRVPDLISRMQQSVTELKGMVDRLESNIQLKDTIQEKRREITAMVGEIRNLLDRPYEPSNKGKHAKLVKSFQQVLNDYQQVVENSLKKEKKIQSRALGNSNPDNNQSRNDPFWPHDNQSGHAEKQIYSGLKEEDVDGKIIQEYNQAIKTTEEDLLLLQETFLDVQQLVGEQKEIIDQAEVHVVTAEQEASQAREELKQANVYKQSSRKKIVIIVCILVILLGVVATVVAVMLKK